MEYSSEKRQELAKDLTRAMSALVRPGNRYIGAGDALAILAGKPDGRIAELSSLLLGSTGHRLVATRYFLANGETWTTFFAWEGPLEKLVTGGPERIKQLASRVQSLRAKLPSAESFAKELASLSLADLATALRGIVEPSDAALRVLVGLDAYPGIRSELHARFQKEHRALLSDSHEAADLVYLASYDLTRFPATTVGGGKLEYVIVADKGEMGTRAVREALELGLVPVVLFSEQDDARALQVRLAEANGGFAISLKGNFRESYAGFEQIARRVHEEYALKFGADAAEKLARSAIYPGYGPLAENTAAIEHFRKSGIVFVGPMQDVVERAGDKRKFRLLAQSIDPDAVVPGIVIDDSDPAKILAAIEKGYAEKKFKFPGRLKAANGGGGRGQMVIPSPDLVHTAVQKVLSEIKANGWDPGVMFEQNIPETIHLEVQVLRDRYGNTRHFGMRDCSEQRASQKIQEEAPPALLRFFPGLEKRICDVAVKIADAVGYVGACTVELMFKDGHFYLLEMNTRIQVEHPVTEAAHRIVIGGEEHPLNLVQLQLHIARGGAIEFAQSDIVATHVAREFRINAESWRKDVKDPRDGKLGLFLPNAGVFDEIVVPNAEQIRRTLVDHGITGIADLGVRLDSGFEEGDTLVNKDPTFAKLIVSVQPEVGREKDAYELLRHASILVLKAMKMRGRQVRPDGSVLDGTVFSTNIEDHVTILESDLVKEHSVAVPKARHVNWVVSSLRAKL